MFYCSQTLKNQIMALAATSEAGVLQDFLTRDPNLFKDALTFSASDVLHLSRRLDAAAKTMAQIAVSLESTSDDDIRDFLSQLILCFLAAGETTRVARGLEKILVATGANCQNLVKEKLGEEWMHILRQLSASGQDLKRVSTLLEHSKLVQSVMPGCIPTLLEQLQHLFDRLMACWPGALKRGDSDKMHHTVKLCLQLFQLYPELRHQGWFQLHQLISKDAVTTGSGSPKAPLASIVSGILGVLTQKCYSRDITLLAGTAISMVTNAAVTPDDSAQCFFSVYAALEKSDPALQMSTLQLDGMAAGDIPDRNCTSEIALVRSIIVGSNQELLCCDVRHSGEEDPLQRQQAFLLRLFPIVCDLCDTGTEFQYLSFQLLSLWIQKLLACLPTLSQKGGNGDLMSKGSAVIAEMLKRIWVSWDSPVEGVAESAAEAFRTLLEVWHAEVQSGRSDYSQLGEELMGKVVQMPWYARARYKPLSLLVPYNNTDKFLRENDCLKEELLKCMGANFLVALANDVYTAFLQSVRNSCDVEEQARKWQSTWLSCVVSGLTHTDSLIRSKVCAYWLPSMVKILPSAGPLLQRHLEEAMRAVGDHSQHSRFLFAWIAVCKVIRTVGGLDLMMLPEQLLVEAVYSDDEDICAEALSLLSATQKKAEPLGETELGLFRAALPYCLKVDSAPFRQKLVTSLKKIFVRIRDSCSTAVKRKTQAQFVDPSLRFIDWLYRLTMTNIAPGACFQRRRACLDIVQAWLEAIIFVEADGAKKGKAHGPADVLIEYAQSKGLWDFFSPQNRTNLLHCVTDGADEIQESAVHILAKYFPWTAEEASSETTSTTAGGGDLAVHLLHHGLELCDSPRAYENHSGSLLVRLVYEKFVRERGHSFEFREDSSESQPWSVTMSTTRLGADSRRHRPACADFVNNVFLGRIASSLKAAEKDALSASKRNPTHGMLQALCECLQVEQASPRLISPEDWQSILMTTVTLSTSTVSLMLHMLAGGQTGNCPSFADMGMALEQLLTGEGATEQEVTSSISPEFQLLLSWCWLNLKESCTCLGLAVALATKQGGHDGLALTQDVIESVGETFLRVLTHCRHRGAIEGCRNGFLLFCTSLMSCDDASLSAIPTSILNQVLSSLEKDEMTSSVTRRSAGLPIIVQTIVQAEKRCKSNKLLQQTVARLYSIASRPPSTQSDQTQDQAPVHALNVLKAIFSDASLSGELLNHLGNMMQLVIRSFESSSWAVRNAATQLVSTLVTRMFGQRHKTTLSCNMMTLEVWGTHFPELLAFVSGKLAGGLRGGDGITGVQPSLFLLLTLLASLGPAAQSSHCHRLTAHLRTTVLDAVSSPVYFLRELSATAVVALTPLDATETCVKELLARVAPESACHNSSNMIHGTLMCLDKLLASRTLSLSAAEEIVEHVLSNTRLMSPASLCPLVCAKCLDILGQAVPLLPPDNALRGRLIEPLVYALFSLPCDKLLLGKTLFTKAAISLIFNLLQLDGPAACTSLQEFVNRCLCSGDAELRSALLDCILQNQEVLCSADGRVLLDRLWHQLCGETDASCVISISKLLVVYYLDQPLRTSISLDAGLCPDDLGVLRSRFENLAIVQAALFPVEALVLSGQFCQHAACVTATDSLSSAVCDWSGRLLEFSQPCQNEDFRMAAAQALSLAGQAVLAGFAGSGGKGMETAVVSLVEACMLLLEETDCDIRQLATRFVGNLQWDKKSPKISRMNSTLCSKVFLAYLCDELGHCQAVQQLLFNKLFSPGELSTCLHRLTQPRTQYLFEHEENTFFSEKILQKLDIYETLVFRTTGSDLSCALPDLLAELRAALPAIQHSTSERPVYNLSGETGVMVALTGLLMQAQLVSRGAERDGGPQQHDEAQFHREDSVSLELKRLFEIPNLHPAISTFLCLV